MLETSVAAVLRKKGSSHVGAVDLHASVQEAARKMQQQGIGSVVAMDGERVCGLLSERECVRRILAEGRDPSATEVAAVMERRIIYVSPSLTAQSCFEIMTTYRVRHLVVADQGTLVGLISIGDVVKSLIADRDFMIEQLDSYIAGPVVQMVARAQHTHMPSAIPG